MKNVLFAVAFGVIIIFFAYCMWLVGKKINYKLSYQSMVREEIRMMVRQEALK